MANYYMYADKLTDVRKWEEYKKEKDKNLKIVPKECNPLFFGRNDEVKHTKFTLEELDLLTSQVKDEETLLTQLIKYDCYKDIIHKQSTITIVHKNNGKLVENKVIYNNKLLAKAAQYVKDEKSNGKKSTEITLPETNIIKEYVERVKSYLQDAEIRTSLISDKVTNNPKLKKAMIEYIENYKTYKYSETEGNFFAEVERELSYRLRKYDVLRKIILFEQTNNLKIEKNKFIKDTKKEEKTVVYKQQELPDIKKTIPKKKLTDDDLIGENNNLGRTNDELTKWYQEGGITSIIENMDIDDIMRYSKEDLESVGLGYLKQEEQKTPNKKL